MDVTDPPSPPGTPVPAHDIGRAAYAATADDRAATDAATTPPLSFDVTRAVLEASGIWHRIQRYLGAVFALPVDRKKVECFLTRAHALAYVHARLAGHAERERVMPALYEEGKELRTRLRKFVELLVLSDTLSERVLENLRPGTGHADVVADLAILVVLLQENPDVLGGPVTADVVARAAAVHFAMTQAAATDHDADVDEEQLRAERRKLAALLLASWAEIRRAMNFIRHYEGDAAILVPTLYPGGRRKGSRDPDAAADPASPEERLAATHDLLHAEGTPPASPIDPEFNPFEPSED